MKPLILIALWSIVLSGRTPVYAAGKVETVDTVLDTFVQSLGGPTACAKFQSHKVSAQMESLGVQGEVIIIARAPNWNYSRLNHARLGPFESGFDGVTAWTKSQGKIGTKRGIELERAKLEADFFPELHFKELYPGLALVGTELLAGEPVTVLERKHDEIGNLRLYFANSTGLLVRKETSFINPQRNELKTETSFSDYRVVDGIKYPHRQQVTVRLKGQVINESTMVIKEIKHNEPIEDTIFKMPSR